MKRVLHVISNLHAESGGPTQVVLGLTQALEAKGIETVIMTTTHEDRGENNARLRLFKQKTGAKWWPGYSPDLARAIEKTIDSFDLVHIHELWNFPHFAAYRAAKRAKKPYVLTVHGGLEPWALHYKSFKKKIYSLIIQRRILKEAGAIHAITNEEVKNIRAFCGHNHIISVPNGIDVEECDVAADDAVFVPR